VEAYIFNIPGPEIAGTRIMLTRLLVLVFVATGASALQLPAAAAVGGLRRCASARMDGTQDRIKDMVESNKARASTRRNRAVSRLTLGALCRSYSS
jgi:hypothetical protein